MIPRFCVLIFCIFVAGCNDTSSNSNEEALGKFSGNMVLAISWQPAFCETRPRVRECRQQKPGDFETSHFSLHGLWPQPGSAIYCGVSDSERQKDKSRKWKKLSGLGLSDRLKNALWKVMPGTRSYLHRHEWVKHGTCYSKSPEVYYADSVQLIDAINNSKIQSLFAQSVGKKLSGRIIREAFDQEFGKGAGDRVRVACRKDGRRTLITELTVGFSGQITPSSSISDLILSAPKTKPGCPSGEIDRVGLQ